MAAAVVDDGGGLAGLSRMKLAGTAILVLVALYFAISAARRRLARFNNIVLFNAVAVLAGTELLLRAFADRLPVGLVQMLPAESRDRLLEARGLFTATSLRGDGMLYAWRPRLRMDDLPWVTVDANGYRNPSVPRSAEVVLLGDSVTVAQNVPEDIASILRKAGRSALNLGFSGYGPFHQRDAYRRYVIQGGIDHRVVVVNFCGCNDVTDAEAYRRIAAQGGSWRDYLGTTPSRTAFPFAFSPPWTVSILFNLPYVVVQEMRNRQAAAPAATRIELPRGTFSAGGWTLPRDGGAAGDAAWAPAESALRDIAALARSAGARMVLAYYPSVAQIYLPGLARDAALREATLRGLQDATSRLARLAAEIGATFLDYTPAMQAANAERLVLAQEGDYHPNQAGVRVMAETLMRHLKSAGRS